MNAYEIPAAFYLGRTVDPSSGELDSSAYIYEAKDLTTHALILGMTGSGKTGLGIDFLEEAAIDGIPALIIDPKGDMANLLLQFPALRGEDFLPWLPQEGSEEARKAQAEKIAAQWRQGLEQWEQGPERIRKLQSSVDWALYTPGSSKGLPLTLFSDHFRPSEAVLANAEDLTDAANATVSSLLALLGIQEDPLSGQRHVFLSQLFLQEWQAGHDPGLADLVTLIQHPPFDRLGVLDLESFYPEKDRFKLAIQINNLIASPAFASQSQGEVLDIQNLLYTREGKPRHVVLSISHLSERERIFFVATLLNRLLSWMRTQPGTSTLRAILYMDEIYGYFPAQENPPTKKPLLTLLKQARAYGLGVILASQNPVDLDYKGLSNIGSWFIGRLQTQQDKDRLLDGLQQMEGNAASRSQLDQLIGQLPKRTFLVNNVHEDHLTLFRTRWTLSYLAGPLSGNQLKRLVPEEKRQVALAQSAQASGAGASAQQAPDSVSTAQQSPAADTSAQQAPSSVSTAQRSSGAGASAQQAPSSGAAQQVPSSGIAAQQVPSSGAAAQQTSNFSAAAQQAPDSGGAAQQFLPDFKGIVPYFLPARPGELYRPYLYAAVDLLFEDSKLNQPLRLKEIWSTPLGRGLIPVDWSVSAGIATEAQDLETQPSPGVPFLPPDSDQMTPQHMKAWQNALVDYIYRNKGLELKKVGRNYLVRRENESEQAFRTRLELAIREERDQKVAMTRESYQKKLESLQNKIRTQEQRLSKEKDQASRAKKDAMVSLGATLLDSFLGSKRIKSTTATKAATTARSLSRQREQEADVNRAEENLRTNQAQYQELEEALKEDLRTIHDQYEEIESAAETVIVNIKKKNISIKAFTLLWGANHD